LDSTRSLSWPVLAAAYLAALFTLDLLTGNGTVLVSAYGLAPVGAALARCPSRPTGGIAIAAMGLAVVADVIQEDGLSDQGAVRLVTVAVLGAVAWWAAEQGERRKHAAERERFLAEVSTTLSSAGGRGEAFRGVARLAVPRLADACAITVVGPGGEHERLADAGELDLLAAGESIAMVARGRPVGELTLASRSPRGGNDEEQALAGRVAERCAVALDAANLLQESLEAQDRLLEAFGLLDVLFERAPVGLAFWDRELRFVRANQRLAEINGAPAEAHIGKTVAQMVPGVPNVIEDQRGVLQTGEPLTDVEVAGETPAATGMRREWTASYWPVRRQGREEVIGLGGVVVEVTDRRAAERALREQTERYETLLEALSQTGVGMVVLDGERLVYANQAFLELIGYSHDELTAMPSIYELVIEEDRAATRRRAAVRLDGRREPGTQLRLRRRDGQTRRFELAGVRQDIAGRPQLVIVARDVTERSRIDAEREALLTRTRFLAEASAVFDEVLDEQRTLDSVAQLCVRELADTCVILAGSAAGSVRRVTTVARDAGDEARLRELNERYPLAERRAHPLFEVLRTGESRVILHDASIEAMGEDERHRELIRSFSSLRSTVLVPLAARGRTVGVMALGFATIVDESAIELFEDLGSRAALAIDNARLYEERTATARTLQRSLLPPELPEIPGIELAARYVAAGEGNEVGGDFYDCFATGGGDWALVIGDVCGKGAEAAVLTALARYTLRASATLHSDRPSRVLAELNDAILAQSANHQFCTVLYASISPREAGVQACMATGGHPLPLLLRADGRVEQPGRPGTLLGILADPEISTEEIELEAGDALILFTDGVTEASPLDDALGPERLAEFVAACAGEDAGEIAQRIRDAALEIQGGTARDDVAVLVLRVPAGEGPSFARSSPGVAAQA